MQSQKRLRAGENKEDIGAFGARHFFNRFMFRKAGIAEVKGFLFGLAKQRELDGAFGAAGDAYFEVARLSGTNKVKAAMYAKAHCCFSMTAIFIGEAPKAAECAMDAYAELKDWKNAVIFAQHAMDGYSLSVNTLNKAGELAKRQKGFEARLLSGKAWGCTMERERIELHAEAARMFAAAGLNSEAAQEFFLAGSTARIGETFPLAEWLFEKAEGLGHPRAKEAADEVNGEIGPLNDPHSAKAQYVRRTAWAMECLELGFDTVAGQEYVAAARAASDGGLYPQALESYAKALEILRKNGQARTTHAPAIAHLEDEMEKIQQKAGF
jgi:tetratricopeptide (TPR) repeat protein